MYLTWPPKAKVKSSQEEPKKKIEQVEGVLEVRRVALVGNRALM
jgi:hypothetical protein